MTLGGHLANPSGIFTHEQASSLQKLALVFATLSVFASIVSLYWFIMMKRNFRRQ